MKSSKVLMGTLALTLLAVLPIVVGARTLPVPLRCQEQTNWCWAACSQAVLDYYGNTIAQCDIANYASSRNGWCTTNICCTNPGSTTCCNKGNCMYGANGCISDILAHWGVNNAGTAAALSVTTVRSEINTNYRPFVIRWGWTGGGGHFIVARGADEVNSGGNVLVWYMDPWPTTGCSQHFSTYSWMVNGDNHTWTHSLTMTTNPPSGSFTSLQNLTGVWKSDAAWADFDHDGDPDLAICGESSNGRITQTYENRSGTLVKRQDLTGISGEGSGCLAWGDYNNDTHIDLAIAGMGNSGRVTGIYKNDGQGNLTWNQTASACFTAVSDASLSWGDYNNDGYLDLAVTGSGSSSQITCVYKNNKNGTFSNTYSIAPGLRCGSADWGMYDAGSTLDLVFTGITAAGTRMIYFIKNAGGGTLSYDGDKGLPGVCLSDTEWGDYDQDGDMDLAVTGETSTGKIARIYNNNGLGTFTQVASLASIYRSSCAWGDYDMDGDLDISFIGYDGSGLYNHTYRNTPTGFTFAFFIGPGVREGSLSFVDIDRDGDADFFMTGADWSTKYARLYRNSRHAPFNEEQPEAISMERISLLEGNTPNPFNPQTTIHYMLPSPAPVSLVVYDAAGRIIRRLVDSQQACGRHAVVWDGRTDGGRSVESGVYFYRLTANGLSQAQKMVLMK